MAKPEEQLLDEGPPSSDEPSEAPEESNEPVGAAVRRRSPALLLSIAAAVIFALTTVGLAISAASLKADKDELVAGGSQDELIAAAGQFVDALFTRDADVDAWRARVVPLATGEFLDQFEDGYDAIVTTSETLGFQSSVAALDEIYTTGTGGSIVRAIVTFDLTTTYADGRVVRNPNQYFVLELIEVDGEWLGRSAADLVRILRSALESSEAPTG